MFIGEVIYGIDMIPIKSIIFDLCRCLNKQKKRETRRLTEKVSETSVSMIQPTISDNTCLRYYG